MENRPYKLGILGGMGPMSTVLFFQLVVEYTYARSDQEHIDILIANRASTPDRTAFLMDNTRNNPLDTLIPDVKMLAAQGADIIAIPCNTAHCFYDEIRQAAGVPVLNMIAETMRYIKANGYRKAAILGTKGTIQSGIYQRYCDESGVEYLIPSQPQQDTLMKIIYEQVKSGKPATPRSIDRMASEFRRRGCDCVILGCTELSMLRKDLDSGMAYIDPLDLLAIRTVIACGRPANLGKGFAGRIVEDPSAAGSSRT